MRFRKDYIDYKGRKTYDYGNEGGTTVGGTVIYGSSSSSTPSTKPQSSPQSPIDTGNTASTNTVVSMVAYETNTGDTPGHWTAGVDGLTHISDGTLVSMRISTACFSNSEGYNTLNINGTGAKMVWFDYGKPLKQELSINDEVLLVYREDAGRYTLPNPNPGGLASDVFPSDGTVRSGWIIVSSDLAAKAGDMKNYYTRDEVDTLITEAFSRTVTSGQVLTMLSSYLEDNNYIHSELISPSDYDNLDMPDSNTLYITGRGNYLGTIDMCCGGSTAETPYYIVNPLYICSDISGGTYTISVMSNTGYTLQSSDNWFTFSPASGYGYGEFTVTIPSGITDETGTITIGDKTVTIERDVFDYYKTQYLTLKNVGNTDGILRFVLFETDPGYWYGTDWRDDDAYYSIDNGEWRSWYNSTDEECTIRPGQEVRIKGINRYGFLRPPYGNKITLSGSTFDVYGNIMSTIYGDNFIGKDYYYTGSTDPSTTTPLFAALFRDSSCVSAKKLVLPSPKLLGPWCYNSMFMNCKQLTTPPKLTGDTLTYACYGHMFQGCTRLSSAPVLPATAMTDYCYVHMFSGCTSLVSVPSSLPATTLAVECYGHMFRGCTSLTTAPELPATALTYSCYDSMFQGCTSLTTAPELPAPAFYNNCYRAMFMECTNLNYVKCLATRGMHSSIDYYDYTSLWLRDVSATGTFVKDASNTTWPYNYAGIPTGWTVVDAT